MALPDPAATTDGNPVVSRGFGAAQGLLSSVAGGPGSRCNMRKKPGERKPVRRTATPAARSAPRPPRLLTYVDAVARYGSIRKAADALNVASSALNRQLLDLEMDLRAPLFERLPRGVRVRAAGEG